VVGGIVGSRVTGGVERSVAVRVIDGPRVWLSVDAGGAVFVELIVRGTDGGGTAEMIEVQPVRKIRIASRGRDAVWSGMAASRDYNNFMG
jgi:hypothetical protein